MYQPVDAIINMSQYSVFEAKHNQPAVRMPTRWFVVRKEPTPSGRDLTGLRL